MSSFQASNLFTTPPTSFFSVLFITFSIFALEWKTYVKLAAFYFLSIVASIVTVGTLAGISLGMSMPTSMQSILPADTRVTRHLMDYASGMSGSSRFLQYYGYKDSSLPMLPYYDIPQNLVPIAIICGLLMILLFIYVASFFVGAFVSTTGDVYCGNRPTYQHSMQIAGSKQWRVFAYNLALTTALQLTSAVVFFVLMHSDIQQALVDPNSIEMDEIMPKLCIFGSITVLIYLSIGTFFIAVVPSIIIENKSLFDACKRSFLLCKNYYWFLFFAVFGYAILFILFSSMTNAIFDALGGIGVIGHLVVNLVESGINVM